MEMLKVLFLQSPQPKPSQTLVFCPPWNGKSSCGNVFLKVMEKGPSNHINRAETRPNLLKKAKQDRAVPCVGLSVASDLNLAVWSLFIISHLVGGITDQNSGNPHRVQPVFNVLLCFAKSSWEEHVEQLKTVELLDLVAWELI